MRPLLITGLTSIVCRQQYENSFVHCISRGKMPSLSRDTVPLTLGSKDRLYAVGYASVFVFLSPFIGITSLEVSPMIIFSSYISRLSCSPPPGQMVPSLLCNEQKMILLTHAEMSYSYYICIRTYSRNYCTVHTSTRPSYWSKN